MRKKHKNNGTTELQLGFGPYRTTFTGIEVLRESTKPEWLNYGEALRHFDEARQWAIGDWLVDGKRHHKDGVYQEAARILGASESSLRMYKSVAERFELFIRINNLSWAHHLEVASIKKIVTNKKGKLELSDEADMDQIQKLLAQAEKEEWSVIALREEVRRYKRQQDEKIRLANEPTKYSIFYADPPWKYSDELIEGYGAAKHHYPSMSIEYLCDLPVKNRVAENAVLFLWVTSPILDECWPVIEAWGFEYKASFVWDKQKHNYGHYNSVRHELLLICTRGTYLPESKELIDSVVAVERSEEHSAKPEAFRELIDTMYPTGNRIELFARGKLPEYWGRWGDEG